ncbi:MAG: FmdB family zinc ribbon protein [Aureliella sp.]
MIRRLRLRCPKCQAPIEVRTPRSDYADATCPRCSLEFVVKVPPRTARHESSLSNIPPASSQAPASSSAIVAQAVPPELPNSAELESTALNEKDALGQAEESTSRPPEFEFWESGQPQRSSLMPIALIGGFATVLFLSLFVVAGFLLVRSSSSMLGDATSNDSSQLVTEDYLGFQQSYFQSGLDADLQNPVEVTKLLNDVPEVSQELESLLRRAIEAPLGTLAERQRFQLQLTELSREYAAKYREKLAGVQSVSHQIAGRLRQDRLADFDCLRLVTREFYLTAIFKMPAPTSAFAEIKHDELKIFRAVLRRLATVETNEQGTEVAEVIREVADQNYELAAQYSRIRADGLSGHRDVGNQREFTKTLEACEMVEDLLLHLLRGRSGVPESLRQAVNEFDYSRQAIEDAQTGATEEALRRRRQQAAEGNLDDFKVESWSREAWRMQIADLSNQNMGLPSDPVVLELSFRNFRAQQPSQNRPGMDWDEFARQGSRIGRPGATTRVVPGQDGGTSGPGTPMTLGRLGIDELLNGTFSGRTTLRIIISPHSPATQREAIQFGSRIRASRSMYVTQGDSGLAGYAFSGDLEEAVAQLHFGRVTEVDYKQRIIYVTAD